MGRCTCEKCISGILSPRMAWRMQNAAVQVAELIRDSMPEFPGGQPVHDPEVLLLDFTPPEVRMEVHKDFVLGFANCFDVVAYLLKQQQLPKPRVIQQTAPFTPGTDKTATQFFFQNRGTAEYVLDALLARIEEEMQSLTAGANGGDVPLAQDDADAAVVAALPACKQDGDVEILRQQLFSSSDFWPCGPYPMDDEGEYGDDDGDGWVHYDTSNWKPPGQQ